MSSLNMFSLRWLGRFLCFIAIAQSQIGASTLSKQLAIGVEDGRTSLTEHDLHPKRSRSLVLPRSRTEYGEHVLVSMSPGVKSSRTTTEYLPSRSNSSPEPVAANENDNVHDDRPESTTNQLVTYPNGSRSSGQVVVEIEPAGDEESDTGSFIEHSVGSDVNSDQDCGCEFMELKEDHEHVILELGLVSMNERNENDGSSSSSSSEVDPSAYRAVTCVTKCSRRLRKEVLKYFSILCQMQWRKSFQFAFMAGVVLFLINYMNLLLAGKMTGENWLKAGLSTYAAFLHVSTGQFLAIKNNHKRLKKASLDYQDGITIRDYLERKEQSFVEKFPKCLVCLLPALLSPSKGQEPGVVLSPFTNDKNADENLPRNVEAPLVPVPEKPSCFPSCKKPSVVGSPTPGNLLRNHSF